jgi:hypothetical protein
MTVSRRDFLATAIGAAALARGASGFTRSGPSAAATINRRALVDRHSPTIQQLNSVSPLSLGNGEFAFTADFTGLQTFPREYRQSMPL